MHVGIEKINLYGGRWYLDLLELAEARGGDPAYVAQHLMCAQRAVFPPWEDAVTMAVNAAQPLLSAADREAIELLIVGTESAVDYGKPLSTWVQRFCDLPAQCRNFEVKHACYGGTAALKMAASWVASGARPGKKALVVSTDHSRNFVGKSWEYIGGGAAVAMLVSAEPQVLGLDLPRAGYWGVEIADTFRPGPGLEIMHDQLSLYAYLDALEGAYEHYLQQVGGVDFDGLFRQHIYHAPFAGMTMLAHRALLGRLGVTGKAAVRDSFERKVAPSLHFARRLGSCYGGSNFVCLLGALQTAPELQPGDALSFFAYGSGCQGEFYEGRVGPAARQWVRELHLDTHLGQRRRLTVEQYAANEQRREHWVACGDYQPCDPADEGYRQCYAGQRLLTLTGVENFQRSYAWS